MEENSVKRVVKRCNMCVGFVMMFVLNRYSMRYIREDCSGGRDWMWWCFVRIDVYKEYALIRRNKM
jgi:hypothetical protein